MRLTIVFIGAGFALCLSACAGSKASLSYDAARANLPAPATALVAKDQLNPGTGRVVDALGKEIGRTFTSKDGATGSEHFHERWFVTDIDKLLAATGNLLIEETTAYTATPFEHEATRAVKSFYTATGDPPTLDGVVVEHRFDTQFVKAAPPLEADVDALPDTPAAHTVKQYECKVSGGSNPGTRGRLRREYHGTNPIIVHEYWLFDGLYEPPSTSGSIKLKLIPETTVEAHLRDWLDHHLYGSGVPAKPFTIYYQIDSYVKALK